SNTTPSVQTDIVARAVDAAVENPFGTGRYSAEKKRLFEESIDMFSFTEAQAMKFAGQACADFGKLMKDTTVKLNIGKINADGKATMGEVCSRKGVPLTNSLTLVRAL